MPATATRRKPPKDDICQRRVFNGAVLRADSIDEKNRTADFVAATENGVDTMMGREFLRIGGLKLDRFRANPVVLDAHNRFEAGAVIGSAHVNIEKRELLTTIKFAETERAETIWQLVRQGFLRAVSVGFIPNRRKILELEEGQKDGRGDAQIVGPARVIKESELFEISVVPVPADAAAVRRYLEDDGAASASEQSRAREEEENMDPKFKEWLAARGIKDVDALSTEQTKLLERDFKASAEPPAEVKPPAQPPGPGTFVEEKRDLSPLELLKRDAAAICPPGLEPVMYELLQEPATTLETLRARFKKDLAERQKPAGNTEPLDAETRDNDDAKSAETKKEIEALSERDVTSILGS